MTRRPAVTLALALLLLIAPHAHAEGVLLRYRFDEGETLRYHDQLALAFQSSAGREPGLRLQLRSDRKLRQEVKRAANGEYTVEIRTTESSTERTIGDEAPERSSDIPDPERVKFTARGVVLERESLGDDESDPTGLTTPLDEFAIVQQVFDRLTFPEREVEAGDTWDQKIEVDLTPASESVRTPSTVKVESRFARRVIVNGEECAELITDFVVPLKTPRGDDDMPSGMTITGDILGHLTTYFSLERGRAIVELATLGAAGRVRMGSGSSQATVRGLMKVNMKTVLEN